MWRLGRKCRICGKRSLRVCGARAAETVTFQGGAFYAWRKWSPCTPAAPGGLAPGLGSLDADGGLDDMSDIIATNNLGVGHNEVR